MMPQKLLLASTLALAVLAAGCAGSDDEATGDDSAFDNDSIYGGDAGVTPDESGMGNQTNETNSTNATNGTSG